MDIIFKLYEVTRCGRVSSIRSGKELRGSVDSDGYRKVSPRVKGVKYQLKVHRLVATKYIENNEGLPQVNHKDGDKLNNRVENLEWCTPRQNIRHAHRIGLSTNEHLKKRVQQISLDTGEILATYDSYREASKATGVSETNISAVCRKYKPKNRPEPRKSAGGYSWRTCNDYGESQYTQASGNGEHTDKV